VTGRAEPWVLSESRFDVGKVHRVSNCVARQIKPLMLHADIVRLR
jgi:hypothetical protein